MATPSYQFVTVAVAFPASWRVLMECDCMQVSVCAFSVCLCGCVRARERDLVAGGGGHHEGAEQRIGRGGLHTWHPPRMGIIISLSTPTQPPPSLTQLSCPHHPCRCIHTLTQMHTHALLNESTHTAP